MRDANRLIRYGVAACVFACACCAVACAAALYALANIILTFLA